MSAVSGGDAVFDRRVAASEDVLMQELPDRELIFLNLRTESYFALAASGARMYRALIEAPTVEGAYERLTTELDADPDRLRSDLRTFVDKLVAEGLIELHE